MLGEDKDGKHGRGKRSGAPRMAEQMEEVDDGQSSRNQKGLSSAEAEALTKKILALRDACSKDIDKKEQKLKTTLVEKSMISNLEKSLTFINSKGKRRENYIMDTLTNMKAIAQANTNRNASLL